MTRKASSSITSGRGVEHHNHDKVYRTSLLHVYPYEENVEYYRNWLKDRNEWLLEEWGLKNP